MERNEMRADVDIDLNKAVVEQVVVEKGMNTLSSKLEILLAERDRLFTMDEQANRLRQQYFEAPSVIDKLSANWQRRSLGLKIVNYCASLIVSLVSMIFFHVFVLPVLCTALFITLTRLLSLHYQALETRFERVEAHCQQVEADVLINKQKLFELSQELQALNHALIEENQLIKQHNEALQTDIGQMNQAVACLDQATELAKKNVLTIDEMGQEWVQKTAETCTLLSDLNQIASLETLNLADISSELSGFNTKVAESVEKLSACVDSIHARCVAFSEVSPNMIVESEPDISDDTKALFIKSEIQTAKNLECQKQIDLMISAHEAVLARVNEYISLSVDTGLLRPYEATL